MANINVSLQGGLIDLTIDTAHNTVRIANQDTRNALFNVFNAATLNGQPAGAVIVWSYTQLANSINTISIPTIDDNGTAINWTVGNVANPKNGVITQTITSPPWQLTMV